MIRNSNRHSSFGSGQKRWIKYAGITMALAVVCTVAFFALWKTDVFGKFEAKEPYVTGEAVRKGVVVTTEGSNQKGKDGSGATPCSAEVPSCTGKKGTETNPFVVLEIVPDKSQRQLIYLGQEEGSFEPLDLLEIGIDFSKNKGKALSDMDSGMFESHELGNWFFHKKYSVYKVGEEDEKESMPFAEIGKLYTLEFTDEDVAKVSEDNTSGKSFGEMLDDIKELSDNYPKLFEKDSNEKKIRNIALKDSYNWKIDKKVDKVSQEFHSPGYMVMVEPGEGDFGFSSYSDLRNWQFTKTGTKADRWVYVKDDAELASKYPEYQKKYDWNNYCVQSTKFVYKDESGTIKHADFSQEKDQNHAFDLVDSPLLTGLVYKIQEGEWVKTPSLVSYKYTFDYYGIKNNNILKRSLFTFRDQDDFDNFHMQVKCMTPAELNTLSKSDNEQTVDMIERADMFYIQSGDFDGNTVNDTDLLKKMYYEYAKDSDASKPDEDITFYENDLEWSLCQKIIERQSSVKTLPLVFNQMVGKLLEGGISRNKSTKETHMYLTNTTGNKRTCVEEKGSRNNLAKLYLISMQFDLLARKKNDEGLKRTFMEDIYPNIKTISLPDESGVVKGTATTTGYYDGSYANPIKLCTCNNVSDDFKKRVYYLWNGYTFFPQDMDEDPLGTNIGDEKVLDKFIEQGYLPTIADGNNNSQPFQSDTLSHHSGSDGQDDKNVTIVHDSSNSNTNHSSFLGNKGDGGDLANTMLEIIFQIMNNQDKAVHPVTVTAEEQRKMYVKIANDTVMIDHEDDGKLESDKELYVKVRFWNNENNRSGQVKEIRLVNEAGDSKRKKLYKDKTFTKECDPWKDLVTGEEMENQYIVSVDNAYLEGYVKFKLSDWKNGYNTLEFDTIGWIYHIKKGSKKGKLKSGNVVTTPISIIGKTLFDLE